MWTTGPPPGRPHLSEQMPFSPFTEVRSQLTAGDSACSRRRGRRPCCQMLPLPTKKSEDKMCSHCPKLTCTKQHRARSSSRCHSSKRWSQTRWLWQCSCVSCPGNGVHRNWELGIDSSAKLPSPAVIQSAAGKGKVTTARVPGPCRVRSSVLGPFPTLSDSVPPTACEVSRLLPHFQMLKMGLKKLSDSFRLTPNLKVGVGADPTS